MSTYYFVSVTNAHLQITSSITNGFKITLIFLSNEIKHNNQQSREKQRNQQSNSTTREKQRNQQTQANPETHNEATQAVKQRFGLNPTAKASGGGEGLRRGK